MFGKGRMRETYEKIIQRIITKCRNKEVKDGNAYFISRLTSNR